MHSARLLKTVQDIDTLLTKLLEGQRTPVRLKKAMRYAVFSGGKRLRPFLLVACASLFRVPRRRALLAGAALECVHAYSLIHDDLPAMDDADWRREKKATHKKFDEATAILAGDALLTFAFEILARPAVHVDGTIRTELITELAKTAGAKGMVGGQMLDLEADGRYTKQKMSLNKIRTMQQLKSAALFSFACQAGAILGSASKKERKALELFGRSFGEAFQIADDLIDIKADTAAGKVTLGTIAGKKSAQAELRHLVQKAQNALKPFGQKTILLKAALHSIRI